MLSPDSPLTSLPRDLPRRQILFLDAIRLSGQMADFAYRALVDTARRLMQRTDKPNPDDATRAITHAYIDAANRLREVVRSMPGLKHNHEYELFMRGTNSVEQLRNVVQHLNQELKTIAERRTASMGTLSWLGPSPAPDCPATAWILQWGSYYPELRTVGSRIDLLTGVTEGGVEDICLTTSATRVDLTHTCDRIQRLIRAIEAAARKLPAKSGKLGSDVLMHFELRPAPTQPQGEA